MFNHDRPLPLGGAILAALLTLQVLLGAAQPPAPGTAPNAATTPAPTATAAPAPAPTDAPQPVPPVLSIPAARMLPRVELANQAIQADLEGIVTMAEPRWWTWILHDGTQAIAFSGTGVPSTLTPGQRVRLQGVMSSGRFAPVLQVTNLTQLGPTALPPARTPNPRSLAAGAEDAQWIELQGVVRDASNSHGLTRWNVIGAQGPFEVLFSSTPIPNAASWVGAEVSLRGSCLTAMNARGQFNAFLLVVNSLADVSRLSEPPADPFALPVRPIDRILDFSPTAQPGQIVRVQGIVTWSRPGHAFQIQDGHFGLAVKLAAGDPPPTGSRVDVVGFPIPGDLSPDLQFAQARVLETTPLPQPRLVDLGKLNAAEDGLRVTTEARFLDFVERADLTEIGLRDDSGRHLLAILARSPNQPMFHNLERGSRLRLTGVYRLESDYSGVPNGHQLLVNDASDIVALEPGPWWNTRRATTAVGALLLLTAGGIAWTVTLRRRVEEQRRTLELELAQRLTLERRHRELTEGAPDAIFTLDACGEILSTNPAGLHLTGYGEEELRQMTIFDLLPHEERFRTSKSLGALFLSGGSSRPFVVDIIHRSGQRRTIEVVSQLIQPPGGTALLEGIARDITERRRAESALSHLVSLTAEGGGERFFRAVSRHTAELLDVDHVFVGTLSPSHPGTIQTLALFSLGQFIDNASYPLAGAPCEGVVGHQERIYPHGVTTRFPGAELIERLRAESYVGLPLRGEANRPLGVLGLVGSRPFHPTQAQLDMLRVLAARLGSEIERIRASEALRTSEERFRELAEHAEDVLWVFDLTERRLAYLGPSFARITGVPSEACREVPRRALRIVDPRDRNRWLKALVETLRGGSGRFSLEYRIIRNGGATRWILDQGVVIRDAFGRATRISGVARDITARKEAELALTAERARFRDLFENSPDAVFVESSEGIVLDVNRAACHLHSLSRERLVGRHATELVPEASRDDFRRKFQDLVNGTRDIAESYSLRSDGSVVPVELQATRIRHEGREALLIHIHDVSARRESELFLAGQKRILEWIATACPIDEILAELARVTEARAPGTLCWTHWFPDPSRPTATLSAPSLDPLHTAAIARWVQPNGILSRRIQNANGQPSILERPFAGPEFTQLLRSQPDNPPASPPQTLPAGTLDRDVVAVPVLGAKGRILGAFGALLAPGRRTSDSDLDLLRLSASLARVAIERHQTDAALREGADRLRTANSELLSLARSEAISRGDLATALSEITEAAARSVRVDRVSVWLLDESAALLRRLHQFSILEPSAETLRDQPLEYRIEELPFYVSALTRERLVSAPDAVADPRLGELYAATDQASVNPSSRLDAGIRLRGRIAGVVVLEHFGPPRHWKIEEELIAGSLADIVAMALQASERRCIEEALRQSEEAYRSVVSALAEGVMLVNRDGAFLAYNDSVPEILGLPVNEFTQRRLDDPRWDVFRLDGTPISAEEFPASITLRTGQPLTDWVIGVRRPDHSIVWISINTRPFARDDDGQVVSVVVSFTDITRRQEAERALREGHELVRAISDVQARFIADADPARNVERMLDTLVRMTRSTGGAVAEVVESPDNTPCLRRFHPPGTPQAGATASRAAGLSELTPLEPAAGNADAGATPADRSRAERTPAPEIADDFLDAIRTLARADTRSIASPAVETAGRSRHLLGLPLLHDGQVVGVVALYRDSTPYDIEAARRLDPLIITCANLACAIRTDRKRQEAEARIRQLNAELEQRVEQRTADLRAINQELAEFAYVVTHDLKAPLRGIHQLSEWLAQDHASQLDSGGLRLLALLRQRVLHLQRLIDGLLACARVGRSPEPQSRIATRELVRQVLSVLAPPANITFSVSDELPVVYGNPERLHQIFQNLLDNAVKYLDKPEGQIRVTALRENGAWQFSVADNGPGIPRRYREKVFQIFQRLHQDTDIPGTGLGLTLVKRIVETRGGRIWIESEADSGTSVCFTWPDHARERPVA